MFILTKSFTLSHFENHVPKSSLYQIHSRMTLMENSRQNDWEDFYDEVQEYFPENAPETREDSVTMTQFVDADHAGNMVNRSSHTGIIINPSRTPIIWYIKK